MTTAANPRLSALQQALARHPELDPQAVLAVFRQEGLGGGIGDGGHAFGPAQLNDAGGVLTGKLPGSTVQQKQAWAWSPQGLEYALSGVSKVAAGQHGSQAVNSIVRGFERPANPDREVAGALASLGQTPASSSAGAGGAAPATPSPAGASAPDQSAFLQALLANRGGGQGLNSRGVLNALMSARQQAPTPTSAPPATKTAPATGGLAELLHEGVGGPTHSTGEHIHVAATNPQTVLGAIRLAQSLGLSVRENPYTDPVDPVHAKNSFHNRTFPGTYGGRKLGEALDASGPEQAMQRFYTALASRYKR